MYKTKVIFYQNLLPSNGDLKDKKPGIEALISIKSINGALSIRVLSCGTLLAALLVLITNGSSPTTAHNANFQNQN